MAEICVSVGCPEVIRLSRQDQCTGDAIPGLTNGAVLRCTRNATLEKVYRDEEVSSFVADCGSPDEYVQEPEIQRFTLSFEVAKFSPETEALLTGEGLITDGLENAGVLYESGQGCRVASPQPRFLAEVFFQRRGACGVGVTTNYVRYVIPGLRFTTELDAEGQIRFVRYVGSSDPTLLSGITDNSAGPYNDFPAGVVTSLNGEDPDLVTPGFWFADPIVDPTSGLTLAAGTCYTAVVPDFPGS